MATNIPKSPVENQIQQENKQSDIAAEIIGSDTHAPTEQPIVREPAATAIPEDIQSDMNLLDDVLGEEDVDPSLEATKALGLEPDTITPEEQAAKDLRVLDQSEAAGVIAPENIGSRIQDMRNARGIYTRDESNRDQEVADLSKEFGVDPQIVDADLAALTVGEARKKYEVPEIARDLPVLAKWMTQPKNYVLAENTGDWTQALSTSIKSLRKDDELGNVVQRSLLDYPKAAIYSALLSGTITPESAREGINFIEAEQAKFEITEDSTNEMQKLQHAETDLVPRITKLFEGLGETALVGAAKAALSLAPDEDVEKLGEALRGLDAEELNETMLPHLAKVYDGSVESLDGIMKYLGIMYENPTGAKLNTAQAAVTSGVPLALILGGSGVGALLKSPTIARSGMISGLGLTGLLAVSSSLQEDLEEYRDPTTGEINLREAFSDPDRVARWRKRALAYSGAQVAGEFIYSKFVGGLITKSVKGGAAGLATGVAKETAVGAAEEAATEFTATVARDLVVDEVTPENLGKAGAKSVTEGLYGAIIGGSIGTATGAIRTGKQKFFKVKSDINTASDANNSMVNVHESKVILNSDEASKTNRNQIQDLIDAGIEPPALPVDESGTPPPLPEIELYGDEEVDAEKIGKIADAQVTNSSVSISPQEMQEFFESKGINPEDALSELPPEIYEQYLTYKDDDISVAIPMSEWLMVLDQFPEIDELVRVAGNPMNSREANEMIDSLQSDPFTLFSDKIDTDEPPSVPQDVSAEDGAVPPLPQDENAEIINETEFEASEVININEIVTPYRGPIEKVAYQKLQRKLRKATKASPNIDKDAADAFAHIQFQVLKSRADNTGRNIEDLVEHVNISGGDSNKAFGTFNFISKNLFFSKDATVKTVPHEFGHSWLDSMSEDYHFISHIPFDKMTDGQKDYWYSMKKSAELLGLENIGELNAMDTQSEEFKVAHETFAETAEEYFLAGKSGDSKVKAAMEAFRDHMIKVIHYIRGFVKHSVRFGSLNLTPEVERMFNGIIGVKNQTDEVLNPMFPESNYDPALLGKEAETAYETVRDVISESVGQFATKIMNASYKERERLISDAHDEAQAEAVEVVGAQPEMLLADQFKEQYDAFRAKEKTDKTALDPRISYTSFEAAFKGDETALEIARSTIPPYIITGKKRKGLYEDYKKN